jgi:predicted nuclease with RNAse H fold
VGGPRKGFDVAVVDESRLLCLKGKLDQAGVREIAERFQPLVIAIDSPRSCAPPGEKTRAGERELNREVCGIRWTPDEAHVRSDNPYYSWIREGLALYEALAGSSSELIEIFPTASWTRWHGARDGCTRSAWSREALLRLEGLPPRMNQDQRDSIAAAVTARQHTLKRTQSFREIVVPLSRPA